MFLHRSSYSESSGSGRYWARTARSLSWLAKHLLQKTLALEEPTVGEVARVVANLAGLASYSVATGGSVMSPF